MPSKTTGSAAIFVVGPLVDSNGALQTGVAYNAAGMDVSLYEETQASVTKTALTLTTGGSQDWIEIGDGYYYVEITAAQLDTAGIVWVGGSATGIIPFESVHYDAVSTTYPDLFKLFLDIIDQSTGQLDAGSFAASAIDAAALATDAVAEIVDAVWDETQSSHTTAGSFGALATDHDTIAAGTMSAAQLAKFGNMLTTVVSGTIHTGAFAATTTEFECDDITEATADHFIGKQVFFVDGPLAGQRTDVTDYALTGGIGHFTVTAMTDAPGNDNTVIFV